MKASIYIVGAFIKIYKLIKIMPHLIDKDTLIAEIKKRRKDWHYGNSIEAKYKREECDDILSLIDTFEVKRDGLRTKFL